MIRDDIEQGIKKVLAAVGAGEVGFVVERPSDMTHGDYSTNAALAVAKLLKKNPKEIAEKFKAELEGKTKGVRKIEVAGAGFINFFLSNEVLMETVERAATDELWGKNDLYEGKMVMVEYTDPNPFKEFHIGHLMSNTIGESIARLLEFAGAKVLRANYQGDVGPHVAKALHGLLLDGIEKPTIAQISAAYVKGARLYEEGAAEKVVIDHLNKEIYEKTNPKVNSLYQYGRQITLEHFEDIYKILGTKFDKYFYESDSAPIGKNLVLSNPEVFEDSTTARIFKGEKVGLHTRVFLTSSPYQLPTYEAKDLGLLKLKKEAESGGGENFYKSITITANEQDEYFKVVLAAAKQIPELADIANKTTHISHGVMRFSEGKMSSRKGNVITGESLLHDLQVAAKEKMQDRKLADADHVAQMIAVGAIKYSVLKQGSGKDIIFDPEKSLSLEGDSGPYLQYAHVRAVSLIKAAKEADIVPERLDSSAAGNRGDASESSRSVLERTLVHYPETILRAAKELEPHYVTTYLTELASSFNSWYASERIIGGAHPSYGLLLATAVEHVLRSGLTVLGIPVPEEM